MNAILLSVPGIIFMSLSILHSITGNDTAAAAWAAAGGVFVCSAVFLRRMER